MVPPLLTLAVEADTIGSVWCVYTHAWFDTPPPPMTSVEPAPIQWVGRCLLSRLFQAPDARDNTAWMDRSPGKQITIRVHAIGPEAMALQADWSRLHAHYKPRCNFEGKPISFVRQRIRCIQDGKEFDTQTAAAAFYGVAQSAISSHLAGKPGFRSVGGFTFIRVQ